MMIVTVPAGTAWQVLCVFGALGFGFVGGFVVSTLTDNAPLGESTMSVSLLAGGVVFVVVWLVLTGRLKVREAPR